MKRSYLAALLILVSGATFAAGPEGGELASPEAYSDLVQCRSIAEDSARLSCLDAAVARLDAARQKRDIVIVDRQQIRKTKRTLFGLPIPRLDIFGGGDDEQDEIKELAGVIRAVGNNADGRWTVRLQDGARWEQIDDRILGLPPKAGDKVLIKRASMGSFMMQVRGQPGMRVRRVS